MAGPGIEHRTSDLRVRCPTFFATRSSCLKVVVVVLLFYVHGKNLRSCGDGGLT